MGRGVPACAARANGRGSTCSRHMKATMRYRLTLARMALIKKSTNNRCWRGLEKKEPSYAVGGNVNWYGHYGQQYGGSLKKLKIELPYDPALPLLGIYPEKNMGKDTCNSQDMEATCIHREMDTEDVGHVYNGYIYIYICILLSH